MAKESPTDQQKLFEAFRKTGGSCSPADAAWHDKNHFFDRKLWDRFSKCGLHGLSAPSSHNGSGFNFLDTCLAFEALAKSCPDNGLVFSSIAHLAACVDPLNLYGSGAQKKNYLKPLASGKWIAANAITEESSGSDVFEMSMTAVKKGKNYILNGEKRFITNAPVSDVMLVYAMTDKAKGFFGGVSCFLVRTNVKGLKIGKPKEKMGLRTAPMADVTFRNVSVSEDKMIGKPGAGGMIFNNSISRERVLVSAFLVGQLSRVLGETVIFTKKRKQKGGTLFELQSVQHCLADVRLILSAAKNLVYDAAKAIDEGSKEAFVKAAMAKLYASEQAVSSLKMLQELYGGYGYLVEGNIEREYRDAYASLIYSGASAIQRNIIAGSL